MASWFGVAAAAAIAGTLQFQGAIAVSISSSPSSTASASSTSTGQGYCWDVGNPAAPSFETYLYGPSGTFSSAITATNYWRSPFDPEADMFCDDGLNYLDYNLFANNTNNSHVLTLDIGDDNAAGGGLLRINTCGSDFDSLLFAGVGCPSDTYNWQCLASADDDDTGCSAGLIGNRTASVEFYVPDGEQYIFVVVAYQPGARLPPGGGGMRYNLTWSYELPTASITATASRTPTRTPAAGVTRSGSPAPTISVSATRSTWPSSTATNTASRTVPPVPSASPSPWCFTRPAANFVTTFTGVTSGVYASSLSTRALTSGAAFEGLGCWNYDYLDPDTGLPDPTNNVTVPPGNKHAIAVVLPPNAPLGGTLTADTCTEPLIDTMLFMSAGGCVDAASSWRCAASSDDSQACPISTSSITYPNVQGRYFYFIVGEYSGRPGPYTFTWSYDASAIVQPSFSATKTASPTRSGSLAAGLSRSSTPSRSPTRSGTSSATPSPSVPLTPLPTPSPGSVTPSSASSPAASPAPGYCASQLTFTAILSGATSGVRIGTTGGSRTTLTYGNCRVQYPPGDEGDTPQFMVLPALPQLLFSLDLGTNAAAVPSNNTRLALTVNLTTSGWVTGDVFDPKIFVGTGCPSGDNYRNFGCRAGNDDMDRDVDPANTNSSVVFPLISGIRIYYILVTGMADTTVNVPFRLTWSAPIAWNSTAYPTMTGSITASGTGTATRTASNTGTPTVTGSATRSGVVVAASSNATSTSTGSGTSTGTATITSSASAAAAASRSASGTVTGSATGSGTGVATMTTTRSANTTGTVTGSGTASGTVGSSPASTFSPTASGAATATATGSAAATVSSTGSGVGTGTPSGSVGGTPAVTSSLTGSSTATGTISGSATGSPIPATASSTGSPGASASGTPSRSASSTGTLSGTGSVAGSPSGTPSLTSSGTPAASGTGTGTGTPSLTRSITPSPTRTPTGSLSSGSTPSQTNTATATPSWSPTASVTSSITPTASVSTSGTGTGSLTSSLTGSITTSPTGTGSDSRTASRTPSGTSTSTTSGSRTPDGSASGTRSSTGSASGTLSSGATPSHSPSYAPVAPVRSSFRLRIAGAGVSWDLLSSSSASTASAIAQALRKDASCLLGGAAAGSQAPAYPGLPGPFYAPRGSALSRSLNASLAVWLTGLTDGGSGLSIGYSRSDDVNAGSEWVAGGPCPPGSTGGRRLQLLEAVERITAGESRNSDGLIRDSNGAAGGSSGRSRRLQGGGSSPSPSASPADASHIDVSLIVELLAPAPIPAANAGSPSSAFTWQRDGLAAAQAAVLASLQKLDASSAADAASARAAVRAAFARVLTSVSTALPNLPPPDIEVSLRVAAAATDDAQYVPAETNRPGVHSAGGGGGSSGSTAGAVGGGIFAAVAILGIAGAFLLIRRRREAAAAAGGGGRGSKRGSGLFDGDWFGGSGSSSSVNSSSNPLSRSGRKVGAKPEDVGFDVAFGSGGDGDNSEMISGSNKALRVHSNRLALAAGTDTGSSSRRQSAMHGVLGESANTPTQAAAKKKAASSSRGAHADVGWDVAFGHSSGGGGDSSKDGDGLFTNAMAHHHHHHGKGGPVSSSNGGGGGKAKPAFIPMGAGLDSAAAAAGADEDPTDGSGRSFEQSNPLARQRQQTGTSSRSKLSQSVLTGLK